MNAPQTSNHVRMPLPLTGAALVAFAALFITGGHFIGLPILAIALVAAYFTRWRLPHNRLLEWLVRGALFGIIGFVIGIPADSVYQWYIKPEYTNLGGALLAAEFVFRAWQRPNPARARFLYGVALFITALILGAAADTYEHAQMQIITPIYILLVALALRTFPPANDGLTQVRSAAMQPRHIITRSFALLLALFLGFTTVYTVHRLDYRLSAFTLEWLQAHQSKHAEIGLSGSPRLQSVFNPEPSVARVMIVDGLRSEEHLRFLSFDVYEHGRWKPSLENRSFAAIDAGLLRGTGGPAWRCTQLSDLNGMLLLPLNADGITSLDALQTDGRGAFRNAVNTVNPPYQIITAEQSGHQGPACALPDAMSRKVLLTFPPEVDAQVYDLASHIAGEGNPASKVARLEEYLTSHNKYSLSFQPVGEPLSDFILNHRSAHCQYFASALVVMARAAGVPCRLVTGYYAHERYGDHAIIVRERDAHAWVECLIDGQGWVVADATPAGGKPDALFPEPSRWQWWERVQDVPAALRRWLADGGRGLLLRGGMVIGAIALLIEAARQITARRRQRLQQARGYGGGSRELTMAAKTFEEFLRRNGVVPQSNQTWGETLSSVEAGHGLNISACREFVALYEQARFNLLSEDRVERVIRLLADITGMRSRSVK